MGHFSTEHPVKDFYFKQWTLFYDSYMYFILLDIDKSVLSLKNCFLPIKIFVSYIKTKYILIYFNYIKTIYLRNMNTRKCQPGLLFTFLFPHSP